MQIAEINWEIWAIFLTFVVAMLALDLGVFNRKAHEVSFKEAVSWSVVWIGLAMVFNAIIFFYWDRIQPNSIYSNNVAGTKFLTGYIIEKALSVDNIFVFIVIFKAFGIPSIYQHRVLFYGVIGALVFRAIFIAVGAALLANFKWLMVPFGIGLILSAYKMLVAHDKQMEPDKNPLVLWLKSKFPVTEKFDGQKFFTKIDGKKFATPLFLALVVVEFGDLVFAIDSVPAVFAVTEQPFLVFTSNIFAILGLRSLFFALVGFVDQFKYLSYGLSAVLAFVGGKMIYNFYFKHFPVGLSLAIIVGLLTISIVASVISNKKAAKNAQNTESTT